MKGYWQLCVFILFSYSIKSQNIIDVKQRYNEVFSYLDCFCSSDINYFYKKNGEIDFIKTPEYFIFGDTLIIHELLENLDEKRETIGAKIVHLEDSICNMLNCPALNSQYSQLWQEKISKRHRGNWLRYLQKEGVVVLNHMNSNCIPFLSPNATILLDKKIKLGKFRTYKQNTYYVMLSKRIENISCALIVPVDHERSNFGITGYLFQSPSPMLFVFVHENDKIIKGAFYNRKLKYKGIFDCPTYE